MRVVFLGTAEFGVPALEALVASEHDVVGVVTGLDKRSGRGRKVHPTPVKVKALEHNLPVLMPERFKDPAFLKAYADWSPDVAVVVAFKILPPAVFDLPRYGTLNIHPSLLPKYRGPAPLAWALINGDDETAVSIIRITRKVDAGGVLLQRRIKLDYQETAGELSDRLGPVGGELVLEAIEKLKNDNLSLIPQDESLVTKAPKLVKEDGLIDWSRNAFDIHNLVRGVTPWPGAYTILDGKTLKLFDSFIVARPGSEQPGTVLANPGDNLLVACGANAVSFAEVQLQGKKRMPVSDFLRGFNLGPGTLLGSK